MGHYISGIIGPTPILSRFALLHALHPPARLSGQLGFLPLSDDHLDSIFPEQGQFDESMLYLSEALKGALASLSKQGLVAYVETEYQGGQGEQRATVYEDGRCLMMPRAAVRGPVSQAMKLLGVFRRKGDSDEFDAAGLGNHRRNERWIEAAVEEERLHRLRSSKDTLDLGYTTEWLTLGIITESGIQEDVKEMAKGEDPPPEHYRWRAFTRFLNAQQPLSPLLARQLYDLGEADVDATMGESMMAEVLRHRDCPAALLQGALQSRHAHLRRIATHRLSEGAGHG
jgi:hypothetical protein